MTVVMYDSVTVGEIPGDAPAVAGYVDGNFANYDELVKRFRKARHLSIAVQADADADCLDVEPGDAVPAQAPRWFHQQKARGLARPCFYTSVSAAEPLIGLLAGAGIPRSTYRLWTAHYTNRPHLCNAACGFGMLTTADATQWTDTALGRNLDQSECQDSFFAVVLPPKPADPHHYGWFTADPFELAGKKLVERAIVEAYDRKRRHPLIHRPGLHKLRGQCTILADRIETVAHEQAINGKDDLGVDHRSWRVKQLDRRALGQRLA
jgi:hypothetical protein